MSRHVLVTAALPYANGSIHLGHLVEYVMTDVYVRALRMSGHRAHYICADDTHGTPIELNAAKAGVSPAEFVARFAAEHLEDFGAFDVAFDHFGSTNTEENRRWAVEIYEKLRDGGHVVRRPLDQLYDEQAGRFLPDRFVKGTCPRCKTPDQYGDVCESCGATYDPTDLIEPKSVVSGTTPVLKQSEHLYVQLDHFAGFLREWVATPGRLPDETRKFCEAWLEGGLKDWCISRDAPYFGFEIPDAPGKFFYVWLDAPVGYVSSTALHDAALAEQVWRRGEAEVVHVIGKDIVYFHTLFWPAMLHAAGLTVPSRVQVHGMLTVDGVKMSKSRGTFINARTFREHLDPSYLRYYYASKIGPRPEDVDLSLDEFVLRTNAELVNNLANLVARGVAFLGDRLGGRYGALPADAEPHLAFARAKLAEAEAAYAGFDLAGAVRAAVEIANLGNKLFQDAEPWKTVATDPEGTRGLVTLCLNLARAAWAIATPVVPSLAAKVGEMLGLGGAPQSFAEAASFDLVERPVGAKDRIVDRIQRKQLDAIVAASRDPAAVAAEEAKAKAAEKAKAEAKKKDDAKKKAKEAAPPAEITIDDFAKIDLRVGVVRAASTVEGADKLLQLTVDLGEERPRNIFAGIRSKYAPEALVGRRVVVVANLAPRKMRFGMSEGMCLAAGPGGQDLWLLDVPEGAPPGAEIK